MGDIDLSNANVTDTHATLLCTLLKSHATSAVQNLDLSGNKLGDAGFVSLCKALSETQVERCVVSANKLTEKSLEQVTGVLKANKSLKTLVLTENKIESTTAKNKFKNALPKIDVVV